MLDRGRSCAPAVMGREGEDGAVVGRDLLNKRERFVGGSVVCAAASVVVDALRSWCVGSLTREEDKLSRSL